MFLYSCAPESQAYQKTAPSKHQSEEQTDQAVEQRPEQAEPVASKEAQPTPIKILSVDGGGIRGVIAARILANIEQITGKRIYEIFDVLAGTSTGALLTILLTAPRSSGIPFTANEAEDIYKKHKDTIFKYSCGYYVPRLACSLRGPLYDASSLEKLLSNLYGNQLFKTLLKPNAITSLAIDEQEGMVLESDEPKFSHLTIGEVSRATSAAPTYFSPKSLKIDDKNMYMVDGGLYKNNPAIIAYRKAVKLFGEKEIMRRGVLFISVGTGIITKKEHNGEKMIKAGAATWAPIIIAAMMGANTKEDQYTIANTINYLPSSKYIRIQSYLDNEKDSTIGDLDNVNDSNMDLLIQAAEKTLQSEAYKEAVELLQKALITAQ